MCSLAAQKADQIVYRAIEQRIHQFANRRALMVSRDALFGTWNRSEREVRLVYVEECEERAAEANHETARDENLLRIYTVYAEETTSEIREPNLENGKAIG